jgi:hypothetical protein
LKFIYSLYSSQHQVEIILSGEGHFFADAETVVLDTSDGGIEQARDVFGIKA